MPQAGRPRRRENVVVRRTGQPRGNRPIREGPRLRRRGGPHRRRIGPDHRPHRGGLRCHMQPCLEQPQAGQDGQTAQQQPGHLGQPGFPEKPEMMAQRFKGRFLHRRRPRRRREQRLRPPVIGRAPLWIAEHIIGLPQGDEGRRIASAGHVRMQHPGLAAERRRDLSLPGLRGQTQPCIVALGIASHGRPASRRGGMAQCSMPHR